MSAYAGKYGTYYASDGAFPSSKRQEYMEANARYIGKFLLAEGWTLYAIAGLLGNMQQESGINPGRWQSLNNTGKGYGLVQWTPGSKYLDWGRNNGYTDPSMDGQLGRILWELRTTQTSDKDVQYFKKAAYPLTFTQFTQFAQAQIALDGRTVSGAYYLGRAFGVNYERSWAILQGGDTAEKALHARGVAAETWYAFLNDNMEIEVSDVITKPLYGYWINSGTIDTLPKDGRGILLFNKSSSDPEKKGHVGAYDGSKGTELQIGGYGKIITLSDGTRKSVSCEQTFNVKHWSHWAQLDVTADEWDTVLAFIRASIKRGDMYLLRGHGNTHVFDGKTYIVFDCAGLIVKAVEEIGYDFWQGCTTMWNRGFMENPDNVDGEDDDDDTETPTLRFGSTGDKVSELQSLLNKFGATLKVDGKFGTNTKAAVTAYQKDNGLKQDGICGPKTWGALLAEAEQPAEEPVINWTIAATEARMAQLLNDNPDLTAVKQS